MDNGLFNGCTSFIISKHLLTDDIIMFMKKTVQQIQDNIFRKMSVEKKIRLASSFWHTAKTISGVNRIYYNIDGVRRYIKKSN